MLAFRSLDPFRALREPDRRRRDEERLSRSEQRTLSKTQNNHLTGKAPYKFESALLQRGVSNEPLWPAGGVARGWDLEFESALLQRRDGMGQAARRWHHRRCSQLMECPDAPAERLEQVPRRPGPK